MISTSIIRQDPNIPRYRLARKPHLRMWLLVIKKMLLFFWPFAFSFIMVTKKEMCQSTSFQDGKTILYGWCSDHVTSSYPQVSTSLVESL